jgi:hypothetical protein
MQRISSRSTFFSKRVFPIIWFGFLAFIVLTMMRIKTAHNAHFSGGVLIGPVIMAIFGFYIMKKLVFDLADEVSDDGDALVVRFGSEEERIPLSEIMNVSYSYMSNPNRVTLTLRTPGRFGKEIAFTPPQRFLPFAKSPIVADLIERIDAARRK